MLHSDLLYLPQYMIQCLLHGSEDGFGAMSHSIELTRKQKKKKKVVKMLHFETNKVFKEINNQILKELARLKTGFSVEKVPMSRWEKSQMITASEFLQI